VFILKSFKCCVLEVRILKGLRVCFAELRILKELEAEEQQAREQTFAEREFVERKEKYGAGVPKWEWAKGWRGDNIWDYSIKR